MSLASVRYAPPSSLLLGSILVGCSAPSDKATSPSRPEGGCVGEPTNRAAPVDRRNAAFSGFVPAGITEVEIQARDVSTGAYVRVGVGQVDANVTFADCNDATGWNRWTARVVLPSNRRYYESAGPNNAIALRSLMLGGPATRGGDAGASADITLYVPCGGVGELCCAPWDAAQHHALAYGEPCARSPSSSCDTCDERGSLCDWDFVCKTQLWPPDSDPAAYTVDITIPSSQISRSWTGDIQGVATDGTYWYFTRGSKSTSRGALYKVSMKTNLDVDLGGGTSNSRLGESISSMPGPYCWHWGDPEVHRGRVYVPMESCDDGKQRVMEVDADSMEVLGTAIVGAGLATFHAPTIAVHPVTGEFYMVDAYDAATSTRTDQLAVYRPRSTVKDFTLTLDRTISLTDLDGETPFSLYVTQGMAISGSGKLYVAAQASNQFVYCFQLSPDKARLMRKFHVEMHEDQAQEYEGIAVFDMGPDIGQVHLFTYQNLQPLGLHFDRGAWFKHIGVSQLGAHPNWY